MLLNRALQRAIAVRIPVPVQAVTAVPTASTTAATPRPVRSVRPVDRSAISAQRSRATIWFDPWRFPIDVSPLSFVRFKNAPLLLIEACFVRSPCTHQVPKNPAPWAPFADPRAASVGPLWDGCGISGVERFGLPCGISGICGIEGVGGAEGVGGIPGIEGVCGIWPIAAPPLPTANTSVPTAANAIDRIHWTEFIESSSCACE
jgi:hypothetical protein